MTWYGVIWAPEVAKFVAVAGLGSGLNQVMTSTDGISWTSVSLPITHNNNWISVCWSPECSLFVAVANSGTHRVMTWDPNVPGSAWTLQSTPANNNWVSVCWSPESSLFVAVANTGTGNRVMTSSNGINWYTKQSAADNMWNSVCWSPEVGLFVAVASSGTGNRVMTSPDGITWTSTSAAVDNDWRSICWAKELGIFVAVAESGTGNRIMISSNGIDWNSDISPADNNWISVCWAPELSKCVAVANSGSGNRVMAITDNNTFSINDTTNVVSNLFINDFTVRKYPPINLSTNPQTIEHHLYGNGTYTLGASSHSSILVNAFDGQYSLTASTYWLGYPYYDIVTRKFIGTLYSTVIDGVAYYGEWVQFNYTVPIRISSYFLAGNDRAYSANTWYLAGSVDGSTWTMLDSKVEEGSLIVSATMTTIPIGIPNVPYYSYFRLVCTELIGPGTATKWALAEFGVNGWTGTTPLII
jgi:hypothetical protein